MSTNRRQYRRYAAAVAAEVDLDGDVCMAETRDISEGGVSLLLDQVLREGAEYPLTLILTQDGIEDPGEEPFDVKGHVMWTAPTDHGEVLAGLRFTALGPADTQRLHRFLSALAESPA